MLAGVAGQDEPATVGLHHQDQLVELPRTDLACLIHHDDRAARELLRFQKPGEGFCRQSIGLQILHLLALRCQHHDRMSARNQTALNFFQSKTLARASPTAK
jgi:hypothetical protein